MKRLFLAAAVILLLSSCITTTADQPEQKVETTAESKPVTETSPERSQTLNADSSQVKPETAAEPEQPEKPALTPERRIVLEDIGRNAPSELKSSISDLALYLDSVCRNDMERAWIIFIWISENIAYDTDAFFYGRTKPQTGASVLQSGKAVCAGYSDIYKSIADIMGLETVSISGHGKGYSYSRGSAINSNHAWTGVKIDGNWMLIDSTWGAGYVGYDKKFYKKFDVYWFDVDPEVMIFTHLPNESAYQFTKHQWTAPEYSALPELKANVFVNGITPELVHSLIERYPDRDLVEDLQRADDYSTMGFSADQITAELLSPDFSGFVKTFSPPKGRRLTAVNLPAAAVLKKGREYNFEYSIENCQRYALIYNGEWHFALREGEAQYRFSGIYDGTIDNDGVVHFKIDCTKAGNLKILAQPEEGDSYGGFLEYIIR